MEILDIIRLVAPEFESVSDTELEMWINLAKPFVSKEKFGEFYNQAVAYLVCHRMTIAGLGSVSDENGELGMLTSLATSTYGIGSISAGSSSISFTNGGGGGAGAIDADTELSRTKYGMQYITIRKLVIVPITINC